jgi:hypothetical protein
MSSRTDKSRKFKSTLQLLDVSALKSLCRKYKMTGFHNLNKSGLVDVLYAKLCPGGEKMVSFLEKERRKINEIVDFLSGDNSDDDSRNDSDSYSPSSPPIISHSPASPQVSYSPSSPYYGPSSPHVCHHDRCHFCNGDESYYKPPTVTYLCYVCQTPTTHQTIPKWQHAEIFLPVCKTGDCIATLHSQPSRL